MSVAELQEFEEVKGELERGQQVGVLTYAEIAGAVSELDLDAGDVEELHGIFEGVEIELVDEIDPALAAAEVERVPAKRTRRKASVELKADMSTDALQLFLKDIGKRRLLTRVRARADGQGDRRGDRHRTGGGRLHQALSERIRQIETQSLKKLQQLPEAQALRDDAQTASGYASDPLRHRA